MPACCGPPVEANLTAALEQYCSEHPGISSSERAAKLAEIDARLLGLEIEEESLIRVAETAGLIIARRPDASPEAVLSDHSEGG